MAVRDRCVAIVLAAGLLLGMAGWQAFSPWLGIGVAVLALVGACVIYRVDPHARDRADDDELEPDDAEADGFSTLRRAAGRP